MSSNESQIVAEVKGLEKSIAEARAAGQEPRAKALEARMSRVLERFHAPDAPSSPDAPDAPPDSE